MPIENEDSAHIVLVDMDNTIVDYDEEFACRWKKERPQDDLKTIYNRKYFEIERNFDESVLNVVHKIMKSEDFFLNLRAFDGSIKALREMEALGLHVVLCTAPSTFQYESAASSKYAWVRKHLGVEWLSRLVVTRDKTLIRGRVLIDDKPMVKGACSSPEWTQILFEQSYNLDVTGKPRIKNWSQWKEQLAPFFPQYLS